MLWPKGPLLFPRGEFNPRTSVTSANLALWLDPSDPLSVMTISGGVSQISDKSGNGRHGTQATPVNRLTMATGINGRATLHGDGAAMRFVQGAPLNLSGGEGFIAAKSTDPLLPSASNDRGLLTFGSAGVGEFLRWGTNNLMFDDFGSTTRRDNLVADGNALLSPFCYHVISTSTKHQIDINARVLFASTTNTVGWDPSGWFLGSSFFSSGPFLLAPWQGYIGEVLLYDGPLSVYDRARVDAYMASKWGTPSINHDLRHIVYEGDSMTANTLYTSALDALMGAGNNGGGAWFASSPWAASANLGLSGDTVANILANAASVDAQYNANLYDYNVNLIFAGTNDICTDGTSGTVTHNNLKSYCLGRRAAGFKVLVATMLPRGPAYEAERVIYNNLIRTQGPTYADAVVDLAADPNMGQADQNFDTTYYSDNIHFNNTGAGLVAGHFRDQLNLVVPAR